MGCGSKNSESPETDGGKVDAHVADAGADVVDAAVEARAPLNCPPDSDGGLKAGFPAPHPSFPSVIYQGAGILEQPQLVTVTFPDDTLAGQLENFDDDLTDTCYWNTVRSGYCTTPGGSTCVGFGAVPAKAHVELTTPAAMSYTDSQSGGSATLQTFIQQQVATGAFPTPNANTLYVLYFPSTTTVTLDGNASCQTFGGYHQSVEVTPPGGTATKVTYAVLPRCTLAEFSSQFDELTFAASHEILEAVTDPFASSSTTGLSAGFYLDPTNEDNLGWNLFGGGEVGDLCVDLIGELHKSTHDQATAMGAHTTYTVQRMWSIAAAAAGGDPCVPALSADEPYFNLAVQQGQGLQQLNVGASATFEADAFSTDALTWSVSASPLLALEGKQSSITVMLDKAMVTNGDKVMVTVKVNSALPVLESTINGEVFLLVSQSGSSYHSWPAVVTAPLTGMEHFNIRSLIHR